MTSPTGNNIHRAFSLLGRACPARGGDRRGFTFLEVMVAVAILSIGIVLIYRSFLIALDYQEHLTNRLYARQFLDGKLSVIQRDYQDKGTIPPGGTAEAHEAVINNRPVTFQLNYELSNVEVMEGIFQLDVALSWREGGRRHRLTRSVYMSRL